MWSHLAQWLSAHLPSQCLACHAWESGGPLCNACLQRFGPIPDQARCTGCGLVLHAVHAPHAQTQAHIDLPLRPAPRRCGACLRQPPPWQHCHVWVDYGYPWADLITRCKLQQQPALAAHLARWALRSPHIAAALAQADVLLPVPLSDQRLRERGFNQAAELARHWCRHLALQQRKAPSCRHDILLRPQHTSAQRSLGRSARLRNLQAAFTVAPEAALAQQRLLVVDDVLTTGATLRAACAALQAAGAQHISVLALARTP